MTASFRFTPRPDGRREVVRRLGYGLLNLGFAIETASKAHTPVHGDPTQGGDFATFDPGAPIGGTLRRSEHAVAYVDGAEIGRHVDPGAPSELPDYVPGEGAVVFVGTNSGYGFWVHHGTSRMPGRPFFTRGIEDVRGRAGELVAAGARKAPGA